MDIQSIKLRFGIIGNSPLLERAIDIASQVSTTDLTVLITGESGTGKESFPKIIHQLSARKHGHYIAVNCGAIPEGTIDSELFGHEKGSFTDATSMKRGLFEIADGGTLFIDEVGEMKTTTQVKLLRVIETHQFRRLGGTHQIGADVRIIAATNRNLTEEIKKTNFREDLYYRLNVFNIHLPPLRERKEDIPLLVKHFIANNQIVGAKKRISDEGLQMLIEHNWPGNVRELNNVLERAIILSTGEMITNEELPLDLHTQRDDDSNGMDTKDLETMMGNFEKKLIVAVLEKCNNNRNDAAKWLKISRAQLYRKLAKYGIGGISETL